MQKQKIWIFQANPNKYQIFDSLSTESGEYWNLNQYAKEVQRGDIVLIWLSGDEAGIYATGEVKNNPAVMPDSIQGQAYWTDKSEGRKIKPRVYIEYKYKFLENPILKKFLEIDPQLWNLKILSFPRGTNFPVSEAEWQSLQKWL